ncbi:MAG: ribosome small subunit-dependent GTPase A [Erysipelotrichaceae bacterium]|nr:ribosome small subunit-dependent GTPase A [Erysipelotrichaceae bacterium]
MAKGFIIKSIAGNYSVYSDNKIYICKARGKFRKENIFPVVGDDVEFDILNENEGFITKIEKRRNFLFRPTIANIDQALIITSLVEPEFSRGLLDRFLTVIEDSNITPIICLSKLDKTDKNKEIETIKNEYSQLGYKVIVYSAKDKRGLKEIDEVITSKRSVLTGQSGAGKSTLLNALFPDLELKEGDYSKALGRGKHTTRDTTFYFHKGGWVADTPGFSSLELKMNAIRLAAIFPGYNAHFDKCKFRGCLHINEKDCCIKQLVEEGSLNKESYENYVSFQTELKEGKKVYTKKR